MCRSPRSPVSPSATWGDVSPERPAVLALHGLTSTSAVWADLAARLPAVPVLAPDLPGRGGSVDVPVAPGLPGLAAAVVRAVDALGLRRVVVVGHSMGAFLAPLVVQQLGGRAEAVVLLDGGVPPEPSVLLRPLVVRALFTLQLRRLVRTWPDVERTPGPPRAARPTTAPTCTPGSGPGPRPSSNRTTAGSGPGWTSGGSSPTRSTASPGPRTCPCSGGAPPRSTCSPPPTGPTTAGPPFLSDAAIAAGREVLPGLTWERVAGQPRHRAVRARRRRRS